MYTRTGDTRRDTGRMGEIFARQYLERSLGWQIILYNWRCRAGELDIVASTDGALVIVEVRTRTTKNCGTPLESVNARKTRQIRRLTRRLLLELDDGSFSSIRFDVVGVTFDRHFITRLEHIRNVVDW